MNSPLTSNEVNVTKENERMSVLDACPRGPRERCNHLNADVCCGGGYDGPCGCPNCHTEWAQTAQRPPLIHLTSKERSSELRAFADVLRDTGRYGVDFADVERASLLSEAADELDRQRAEIERMRSALQWYADHMGASKSMDMRIVVQDGGKRAKDALAGSPVETTADAGPVIDHEDYDGNGRPRHKL